MGTATTERWERFVDNAAQHSEYDPRWHFWVFLTGLQLMYDEYIATRIGVNQG